MIVKNLHCEYLTNRFHVLSNCDKKQAVKWMNKKYKEADFGDPGDSDGSTWYWNNKKGQLSIVIWIRPKLSPKDRWYTIIHEIGHAIFILMKRAGVDPTDSNGEHFVYLQEYLTEQSINKQKTSKNPNKKCIDKSKK